MKALLITLGVLALLILVAANGYLDFSNAANNFENQITHQWDNNRNIYDNGWKKVQEVAQVPELYAAKVKEVFVAAIQGRYGNNGAQQTFLALQEANPSIDSSVFVRIQQVVEEFHNQFEQSQTRLISIKQEYANLRTATTSGRFYNMFSHYPHIDLTKYDIVTSDKTEHDFETKRAPVLEIAPKK